MKRLLVSALLLGVVALTGYGVVVHGLSYRVVGFRPLPPPLDQPHLAALQTRLQMASGNAATPATLRQFALAETAQRLHFALKRNALTDPNKIVDGQQAHCKMYAYVVAATYNQLAWQRYWPPTCHVAYGHAYLYGVSLISLFQAPSSKTTTSACSPINTGLTPAMLPFTITSWWSGFACATKRDAV
jgi:hypothetical protein